MLNRTATVALASWAEKKSRKPLVMLGARQVGKTFLLKRFGEQNFRTVHYYNFEEQTDLAKIFESDLSPNRIIGELELKSNQSIKTDSDLIIFDEIQSCPRALTSLKYFAEKLSRLAVCAAGSLLDLELNSSSFPVGNVHLLDLYPLSFAEFVEAVGGQRLALALRSQAKTETFSDVAHDEIWRLLKLYFVSGGLPANVNLLINNSSPTVELFEQLRSQQQQLIRNYSADMAKHSGKVNAMHLERVFRAVATQLVQVQDDSTKRFRMSGVIPGVTQYSRLVNVFDWLAKAGLIIRVPVLTKAVVPLISQVKEGRMKVYPFDIGLLGALANIDPKTIYDFNFGSYKGYMAESFVAQELRVNGTEAFYAWQQAQAEIEFLVEYGGVCYPIEVKSGTNTRSRSMRSYIQRYGPKTSFILSAKRLTLAQTEESPHMLPLYLVGCWSEQVANQIG